MSIIDQIKAPIQDEMDSFESKFKISMASKVPLLDKVINYIVKRKGKQMRPMFVFLSAKMFGEVRCNNKVLKKNDFGKFGAFV